MVMAEVQAPASMQAAPILSSVADVQAQTADFADVEGITLNELEVDSVKGGMGAIENKILAKNGYKATQITTNESFKLGPYSYEKTTTYVLDDSNKKSNQKSSSSTIGEKRKGGWFIK